MKRRILTVLFLALLLPMILLLCGAWLPSYYADTYYAQLAVLYEKLETTQGKRVVVLGGSNVAFGVDSAQMERILRQCGYDYTVCNFGLYGAVGTSAMLSLSQSLIREGDVVVLAIEPASETFSSYFGATAMLKCAEDDPKILLHLNKSQHTAVVGNYLSYLQERVQIYRTGLVPQPEGAYAKVSFDENGDMRYERAGNAMLLGYDSAQTIDLENVWLEETFVQQLNDYIQTAEKKGARVFMSFSPMNRGAMVDDSQEAVYRFFTTLQTQINCPIISDPNDYILDSGWFYDSNFHLNTAGMAVRTYQLSCDLLNDLGYYEDVPFEMPQMPDFIAQVEENVTDGGMFTYESQGETGLLVSGLTEQGRQKTALVVPSSYNGKPVVGLTQSAFSGNVDLQELTLPASIESIPDRAFAGCISLIRLNLLHQETTPDVGEGLLEGTSQLKIYVPQSAYHLYRDGAGCAVDLWQGYLKYIIAY